MLRTRKRGTECASRLISQLDMMLQCAGCMDMWCGVFQIRTPHPFSLGAEHRPGTSVTRPPIDCFAFNLNRVALFSFLWYCHLIWSWGKNYENTLKWFYIPKSLENLRPKWWRDYEKSAAHQGPWKCAHFKATFTRRYIQSANSMCLSTLFTMHFFPQSTRSSAHISSVPKKKRTQRTSAFLSIFFFRAHIKYSLRWAPLTLFGQAWLVHQGAAAAKITRFSSNVTRLDKKYAQVPTTRAAGL